MRTRYCIGEVSIGREQDRPGQQRLAIIVIGSDLYQLLVENIVKTNTVLDSWQQVMLKELLDRWRPSSQDLHPTEIKSSKEPGIPSQCNQDLELIRELNDIWKPRFLECSKEKPGSMFKVTSTQIEMASGFFKPKYDVETHDVCIETKRTKTKGSCMCCIPSVAIMIHCGCHYDPWFRALSFPMMIFNYSKQVLTWVSMHFWRKSRVTITSNADPHMEMVGIESKGQGLARSSSDQQGLEHDVVHDALCC